MSEQPDESFKSMDLKTKIITISGISLLILLVVGFILALFFFGFAGVFTLLGIQYQSIWSLVLFVISFFIAGLIIEVPFDLMTTLTVRRLTDKTAAFVSQFVFEFAANWITLVIVDSFMTSITLSFKTKVILTLLLALLGTVFDRKK